MKYLIAILVLASSSCWGAYTYVQSNDCGNSVTSLTCQYDSAVTTNDLLIVACMGNSLTACFNVSDDQGDIFTLIGGTTTTAAPSGGTLVYGIWWSTATAGFLTTVTCEDLCANTAVTQMSIHEYSGNAYRTTVFDTYTSSNPATFITTTTTVAPQLTPARNGELIFSLAPQLPAAATAGNGTIRTNAAFTTFWATEDIIQEAASVVQSSFTFPSSAGYVNKISQAAFFPPIQDPRGAEEYR